MLGISYKFRGIQMEPAWFHEDALSRTAANSLYTELKSIPGVTDIKVSGAKTTERKAEPEKKIALVAFKLYGYVVPADTKEGDFIKVIAGGEPVQLEVLRITDNRKPGINYIPAEEVIHS